MTHQPVLEQPAISGFLSPPVGSSLGPLLYDLVQVFSGGAGGWLFFQGEAWESGSLQWAFVCFDAVGSHHLFFAVPGVARAG